MKKCLALFFAFFIPISAEETINEITAKDGQNYNYISEFLHMLAMLAFVIVLIFISVWFLKKIMRSRVQTLNRTNGIKILERRPLNPKASLYLVDILGKGVVVSESASGIHLVTEFPENVNIEELYEKIQEGQNSQPSFFAGLTQKIKGMKKPMAG